MALHFAGVTHHNAPYVGQWLLSCLFLTLLVASQVAAQDPDRRRVAFAGGGFCPTPDIQGGCFVGGVGLPLGVTNSFEVDVLFVPSHRAMQRIESVRVMAGLLGRTTTAA